MKKIENNLINYNDTQRKILDYLFKNQKAVIKELAGFTDVNSKTVRLYLNQFIEDGVIERISEKIRDKNALYVLKKH